MATFNSLVDAQCGNAAPLVQLTRLYTNDKTNVLQVNREIQTFDDCY